MPRPTSSPLRPARSSLRPARQPFVDGQHEADAPTVARAIVRERLRIADWLDARKQHALARELRSGA